jgi:hypothetical protein
VVTHGKIVITSKKITQCVIVVVKCAPCGGFVMEY